MQNTLRFSPISTALLFAAIAISSILAMQMLVANRAAIVSAPAVQVPRSGSSISEARLAKGTEGLLRQTAEHLSRMQRGESIGGFPGLEPPDDDDKYRRKIKDQSYRAEEVNHWVKEINNFLTQIVKKNSGLSLEEILQKQGLTPSQIESFFDALRNAEVMARGMQDYGVTAETATTLRTLMETLGVAPWLY